jgi:hypothetical protein
MDGARRLAEHPPMRIGFGNLLYHLPLLGSLLRHRSELSARVAELETQNGMLQDDLRRQHAYIVQASALEADVQRLTAERNRAVQIAVESGRALLRK